MKQVKKTGRGYIVYDDSLVSHIEPEMFDAENWPNTTIVPGYSGGRGATHFIHNGASQWVLKHYHRGGFIGRFLNDSFLWFGLERCRSVVEWGVLAAIQAERLPGPRPIAAHIERIGPIYKADLLSLRIPNVVPLSNRLCERALGKDTWHEVGVCIAEFHCKGFYHADLSAHNLQIDTQEKIFLLDWDRGSRRKPGAWQRNNLQRLQRSLQKITDLDQANYRADDWEALIAGYQAKLG